MDVRVRRDAEVTPLRVLVVEDDLINRKLLAHAVEAFGGVPTTAADGAEAVLIAADLPYDLVLMDLGMPNVDGYEATRRLREGGFAGRIIAVTGELDRQELAKVRAAGFDDLLVKPVDMDELARRISAPAA